MGAGLGKPFVCSPSVLPTSTTPLHQRSSTLELIQRQRFPNTSDCSSDCSSATICYASAAKAWLMDSFSTVDSSRRAALTVTDVTGEVVQSGPGVKDFKPGDKVVSMLNFLKGGGLAEYAVVPLKTTVKRPPEVLPEAAGLPIAGLTALQAVRDVAGIKLDGSSKGVNLLITAASGGVGHFAVQLAKLGNAHVTATCGGRNIELVKKLGADEVLDYKTPEGASLTSPSGRKYDVVIHCASDITWSTFEPNLGTYGKVIDITPTFKSFLASVTKKITFSKKQLVPLLMIPRGENLALLVDLVKEQKLKIVVDSMYPLAKAEGAWAKIMDGHATGKVIVNI